MPTLRWIPSGDLTPSETLAIRRLLREAFERDGEGFTDDDWLHALGGDHVLLADAGGLIAHAAVVERELHVGSRPLRTGYVEAVATRPEHQGKGHGSAVMRAVSDHIRATYEFGALSTGRPAFYERLGWRPWIGPTAVRTGHRTQLTPDDDGGILVLPTRSTPRMDLRARISCPWRSGDVW